MFRELTFTLLTCLTFAGCIDESAEPDVAMTESAVAVSYPVYLRWLSIDHTGETFGDPEIYVRCHVGGRYYSRVWLDSVNDANEWYAPNVYVGTVYPGEFISCDFRESDGSTADDYIGHVEIDYNSLGGTTGTTCGYYGVGVNAGLSHVKGVDQCPGNPFMDCAQDC